MWDLSTPPLRKTPAYTLRIDRCVAPLQNRASQHGGRSSVGRAQGCGPWGRGFEPRRSPFNPTKHAKTNLRSHPRHQQIGGRPLGFTDVMRGLAVLLVLVMA